MGIGSISNLVAAVMVQVRIDVSIPNGDRLYLELGKRTKLPPRFLVSIPNGDRLYLEPRECWELSDEV